MSAAIVIAFDGIVADTPSRRAAALQAALRDEGVASTHDATMHAIGGRTLAEAARVLVEAAHHRQGQEMHGAGSEVDETLVDLVALRAARAYRAALGPTGCVTPDAVRFVAEEAGRGRRLLLRADSDRADVEAVLAHGGLLDYFAIVRCGDDRNVRSSPAGHRESSLHAAWREIHARLEAVGVTAERRTAIESNERAIDAARAYARVVLGRLPGNA